MCALVLDRADAWGVISWAALFPVLLTGGARSCSAGRAAAAPATSFSSPGSAGMAWLVVGREFPRVLGQCSGEVDCTDCRVGVAAVLPRALRRQPSDFCAVPGAVRTGGLDRRGAAPLLVLCWPLGWSILIAKYVAFQHLLCSLRALDAVARGAVAAAGLAQRRDAGTGRADLSALLRVGRHSRLRASAFSRSARRSAG